MNAHTNIQANLHCTPVVGYEEIYEAAYDYGFVFYDEEELEESEFSSLSSSIF